MSFFSQPKLRIPTFQSPTKEKQPGSTEPGNREDERNKRLRGSAGAWSNFGALLNVPSLPASLFAPRSASTSQQSTNAPPQQQSAPEASTSTAQRVTLEELVNNEEEDEVPGPVPDVDLEDYVPARPSPEPKPAPSVTKKERKRKSAPTAAPAPAPEPAQKKTKRVEKDTKVEVRKSPRKPVTQPKSKTVAESKEKASIGTSKEVVGLPKKERKGVLKVGSSKSLRGEIRSAADDNDVEDDDLTPEPDASRPKKRVRLSALFDTAPSSPSASETSSDEKSIKKKKGFTIHTRRTKSNKGRLNAVDVVYGAVESVLKERLDAENSKSVEKGLKDYLNLVRVRLLNQSDTTSLLTSLSSRISSSRLTSKKLRQSILETQLQRGSVSRRMREEESGWKKSRKRVDLERGLHGFLGGLEGLAGELEGGERGEKGQRGLEERLQGIVNHLGMGEKVERLNKEVKEQINSE